MFRTAKTLFLCLITSALSAQVSHSIVDSYAQHTQRQSVRQECYSKAQLAAIDKAFGAKTRFKVMSFNMLTDLFDRQQRPENRWGKRKGRVASCINLHRPDIILSQELSWDQIDQLKELLDIEYEFYGVEGNRGFVEGVFYRPDRFESLEDKVWYLDEKRRTLTMCHLRDTETGESFFALSTHLASGYGVEKRHESALKIVELIEPLAAKAPVIFGGDYNTIPAAPAANQLPALDGGWVMQVLQSGSLRDSRDVALVGVIGNQSSWTSSQNNPMPFSGFGHPGLILDHIMVAGGAKVILSAIDPIKIDGCFPSDHMPVICEVALDR